MHTDPMIEMTPSRRVPLRPTRGALRVTSAGMTDVGRVRSSNEDRFLVAPLAGAGAGPAAGHLFAVADGVGGSRGGGVASALAIETIERTGLSPLTRLAQDQAPRPGGVPDELRALFRRADTRLAEEVARRPALRGMGTTLTVAVLLGRTMFVGHVGDSRCYVLRSGGLRRVTKDHTVAAELARSGLVEPEHVADHPFRNVLSNCVGFGDKMEVELHAVDLAPGDAVLLCSDGLTGMVPSPDIAAILRAAKQADRACQALVARANAAGGHDNVTAVVAYAALAD
jgi:protein phosphatase